MGEDFLHYMNDPSLLHQADVTALEKFAEQFPYFSVAQILLAKKYQLLNHPNAARQLSKAALVAGDRRWLHDFLNENFAPVHKGHETISERKDFETKESELAQVLSSNEDLHEMLKSIHEKKQAILNSANKNGRGIEKEVDEFEAEKKLIGDLSASQSEISGIDVEEESAEQQQKELNEIDVVNKIETEIIDQLEFEEQEGLIALNETAGAGAEYVPTEFVQQEEQEEDFIVEQDVELQSFNVIEEEFYEREMEFENQEKEIEKISSLENEPESFEAQPVETDISSSEIKSDSVLEEELIDHESFEIIEERNQDEDVKPVVTANESEMQHEELQINETVQSPGEFLPQKSYTFTQWLKFFSYEKLKKNEAVNKVSQPVEVTVQQEERSQLRNMEDEFFELDKMVSSIQHPIANLVEEKSAEELAKKSTEWDEELVSETLAKILEEQGSYEKAIRMYVKLSLRFPDKVSFFAARIREIKSKK
ncbi:MAG: hypothetical protein ACHQD9_00590 [Chitinophagales bacterium]